MTDNEEFEKPSGISQTPLRSALNTATKKEGYSKHSNVKGVIIWCSRKKNGIKLNSPNENLCSAYLKK